MLNGFENPVLFSPFLNPDESMIECLMYIVSSSYQIFRIYGALILTEGMRHYSGTNNNQSVTFLLHCFNQCNYFHLIDLHIYINIFLY